MKLRDVDIDIIASILTGGLIRNMIMRLDFNNVSDIFIRVKNRLSELKME